MRGLVRERSVAFDMHSRRHAPPPHTVPSHRPEFDRPCLPVLRQTSIAGICTLAFVCLCLEAIRVSCTGYGGHRTRRTPGRFLVRTIPGTRLFSSVHRPILLSFPQTTSYTHPLYLPHPTLAGGTIAIAIELPIGRAKDRQGHDQDSKSDLRHTRDS